MMARGGKGCASKASKSQPNHENRSIDELKLLKKRHASQCYSGSEKHGKYF